MIPENTSPRRAGADLNGDDWGITMQESPTVFAVFKHGVHRHECGGLFTSFELAKDAAVEFIKGERDDHHRFDIVPLDVNKRAVQTPVTIRENGLVLGGELIEPAPMLSVSRTTIDAGVTISLDWPAANYPHERTETARTSDEK